MANWSGCKVEPVVARASKQPNRLAPSRCSCYCCCVIVSPNSISQDFPKNTSLPTCAASHHTHRIGSAPFSSRTTLPIFFFGNHQPKTYSQPQTNSNLAVLSLSSRMALSQGCRLLTLLLLQSSLDAMEKRRRHDERRCTQHTQRGWCNLKSVRRATRPTDRGAGRAMTVDLGSYRISKLVNGALLVEAGAPNWNVHQKRLRAIHKIVLLLY